VEVTDGPAEVFVNGRWMGRAGDNAGRALEIKVPAGEQLVQVKRDGHQLLEQRIDARAGEAVKVAANLSRIGSLPATRPAAAPAAVHAAYEKLLTWVFRNGGSVTAVTGKGQQLSLVAASPLPDEPLEIIAIRLGGTGIRDAELAHLKSSPGLRQLSLGNTPITDAGLSHLQHLRELTHLDLGETAISSEGLASVSRLAQLVELDLQKTKITDPGLTRLAGLSKLQRLYLSDTPISDAGVEQLRLLPALEHVVLHGTGLSETGHQALASARPQLEIAWDGADVERQTALRLLEKGVTLIVVDRAGKSHENLHARENLPPGRVSVKAVDATSAGRFGDEDLKQLALLPNVESLSLAGAAVTPEGLAQLHGLTTLKTLDLGSLRLPAAAVDALRKALTGCQVVLKEPPDAEVARMVLAAGGKVSIFTAEGKLVADIAETAALPAAGFFVRSVNAEGVSAIDDAAVARLSDLPDLESLFLGRTSLTDEGVAHLAGCRALRELSLSETGVTSAGIGALMRLPVLERLYLAKTPIGGEGARRAATLAQLTHLSLQGVQLADDDLALLKRLERLEWLDVSATPLSDAALVHLGQLGKLRQLNIAATSLSDAGLEELKMALPTCSISGDPPDSQRLAARWIIQHKGTITLESGQLTSLADLPRDACRIVAVDLAEVEKLDPALLVRHLGACSDVVSINLSETKLREADLQFLAALASLRELRLVNLPVSDATLKRLAGHGKLEVLDLSGTRVTGAGLADLATSAELKQLLLANTQIDQKHLQALAAFPKLEVLSLAAAKSVGDPGLAHIEKLTALKSLDLRGSKVGDAGMVRLARLTELEQLDLEGTAVTSAGIGKLAGLVRLRRINLAQTAVGDDVTATLAQLKQLKSINLARTTVSAESIRQLQAALPGCAIIAPTRAPRDPNEPSGELRAPR
jgi:Leucine-rich repeat (LRR) protein